MRTQRNVVAALAALACLALAPAGLAAQDYLGVAPPKVTTAPAEAVTCAACHGAKGVAIAPTFPNLAGQNYNYLLKSLEDFRAGKWQATPMDAIIKTVPVAGGNANIKALAAYFSHFKRDEAATAAAAGKIPEAEAKAGYQLYFEGNPKAPIPIPSCAACHIATGMGDAPMAVPRLAGQNAAYVAAQLAAFKSGKRHNSPDGVMGKIASRLTEKDIQDVAAYVSHMRPSLLPGSGPKTLDDFMKVSKGTPVPGIPASEIIPAHKP
ncbi:MAG TPA: c-type cytochrome [Rhodanobacteraceae bacterium]